MLYLTMLSCCVVHSQQAVAMFFNIVSEIKRNLLPDVQKGGVTEL